MELEVLIQVTLKWRDEPELSSWGLSIPTGPKEVGKEREMTPFRSQSGCEGGLFSPLLACKQKATSQGTPQPLKAKIPLDLQKDLQPADMLILI